MIIASLRGHGFGKMLRLDRRYLLGCGAFFVAYMICFYAALGFRPQPEFMSLVAGEWLDNEGNR